MTDQQLSRAMATAICQLERDGEIVVTSPSIEPLAARLAEAALNVVPSTDLSLDELWGVRSLILHAIANKQFFDWEMPTLTGFYSRRVRADRRKATVRLIEGPLSAKSSRHLSVLT